MSTEFAQELGRIIGCVEAGIKPESFAAYEGVAEGMDGQKAAAAGRLVLEAARDVLNFSGYFKTAPAYHLDLVTKQADWTRHSEELVGDVVRVLQVLEPQWKQAASVSDAVAGAGAMGRTALYGSMGMGGGLGALYWLLSRHANQDDADLEAKQQQLDYYNQLGKELNDSMRRKYRYDGSSDGKLDKGVRNAA